MTIEIYKVQKDQLVLKTEVLTEQVYLKKILKLAYFDFINKGETMFTVKQEITIPWLIIPNLITGLTLFLTGKYL